MQATARDLDRQAFGPARAALMQVDPRQEDAYWQRSHRRERYVRPGFDYEDYAPAYCVGYIGYAQYGGAFDDAEPWLCANWERIKGDSRLGLDEARLAMRSAWVRVARRASNRAALIASVRLLRRWLRVPSFKLSPRLMR